MTVENVERDQALADILYRLTEVQGDLVALGTRDAASLVAIAIGLVLESDAAAPDRVANGKAHAGHGATANGHHDVADEARARTGSGPLH